MSSGDYSVPRVCEDCGEAFVSRDKFWSHASKHLPAPDYDSRTEEGRTEFPLAGFYRELTVRNKEFAEELLEASIKDLRLMLDGKPRTDTFKPDTDPVDIVVQHAEQVSLCRTILKLDDEARDE